MKEKLLAVRPRHVAAFLVVPALQFILMEGCTALVVPFMIPWTMLASILYLSLLGLALCFLTRRPRLVYTVTGIVTISTGLLSAYLVHMRGTPFSLVDIMSAGTALSVAGNYGFYCDFRMVSCALLSLVLIVLLWRWYGMFGPFLDIFREMHVYSRQAFFAVFFAALYFTGVWIVRDYAYRVELANVPGRGHDCIVVMKPLESRLRVGTVYDFIFSASQFTGGRPAGYDADAVSDDNFEYSVPDDASGLSDVIVIMDEAFSDPDDFGGSHAASEYMPFLKSLDGQANSRTGSLEVSVLGGNTANTEFEVLTGASLSQFPTASVPYLYAVNRDIPSLARYFSELGYETWAVHPHRSDNWNRSDVYSRMGFGHMVFTDMPDSGISFDGMPADSSVEYISDSDCLSVVSDILNKRDSDGRPRFVFVVTVQNHGPYTYNYSGIDQTVDVGPEIQDGTDREAMSRYLSYIRASDEALREFTEYLSERESGALIAFFGDHQPDASAHMRFEAYAEPGSVINSYKVPYAVWSTGDLSDDLDLGHKSACYVGVDLFKCLGLGMPDYYRFMDGMLEGLPVQGRDVNRDTGLRMLYDSYTWYRIRDSRGWRIDHDVG